MMIKALIDTNVLLDTLCIRTPYNASSDQIFDLITDNKIKGYITTSSVTDVYYLLRKVFDDETSKSKVKDLLRLLKLLR